MIVLLGALLCCLIIASAAARPSAGFAAETTMGCSPVTADLRAGDRDPGVSFCRRPGTCPSQNAGVINSGQAAGAPVSSYHSWTLSAAITRRGLNAAPEPPPPKHPV